MFILETIWGLVKGLFTNPKAAFITLVVIAALYGAWDIHHRFELTDEAIAAEQAKNVTLAKERDQLKIDVANAVSVNKENQITIQELSDAKTDSAKRVAELQQAQKTNEKTIAGLRGRIADTKPQDDGPLANVLRDTIKSIQNTREAAQ